MSIVLLGQPMVIINSYKHAYELLEKRSGIYSDRPHLIMAGDIVGWDQILVLLRYGGQFREYRRLMARVLGSRKSVVAFTPVIEEQTSQLLVRLLREPTSDLPEQIRKYVPSSPLMHAGPIPEPALCHCVLTHALASRYRPRCCMTSSLLTGGFCVHNSFQDDGGDRSHDLVRIPASGRERSSNQNGRRSHGASCRSRATRCLPRGRLPFP